MVNKYPTFKIEYQVGTKLKTAIVINCRTSNGAIRAIEKMIKKRSNNVEFPYNICVWKLISSDLEVPTVEETNHIIEVM